MSERIDLSDLHRVAVDLERDFSRLADEVENGGVTDDLGEIRLFVDRIRSLTDPKRSSHRGIDEYRQLEAHVGRLSEVIDVGLGRRDVLERAAAVLKKLTAGATSRPPEREFVAVLQEKPASGQGVRTSPSPQDPFSAEDPVDGGMSTHLGVVEPGKGSIVTSHDPERVEALRAAARFFFLAHYDRLAERYHGQHVAVTYDRVVAAGANSRSLGEKLRTMKKSGVVFYTHWSAPLYHPDVRMKDESIFHLRTEEGVARITLPPKYHSVPLVRLVPWIFKELDLVLTRAFHDDTVHTVVLDNLSDWPPVLKGAWVTELLMNGTRVYDVLCLIAQGRELAGKIAHSPKRVVARVNGEISGLPLEVALAANFVVMHEGATLQFDDALPTLGTAERMAYRMGRGLAFYTLLSEGVTPLRAGDAMDLGLADFVAGQGSDEAILEEIVKWPDPWKWRQMLELARGEEEGRTQREPPGEGERGIIGHEEDEQARTREGDMRLIAGHGAEIAAKAEAAPLVLPDGTPVRLTPEEMKAMTRLTGSWIRTAEARNGALGKAEQWVRENPDSLAGFLRGEQGDADASGQLSRKAQQFLKRLRRGLEFSGLASVVDTMWAMTGPISDLTALDLISLLLATPDLTLPDVTLEDVTPEGEDPPLPETREGMKRELALSFTAAMGRAFAEEVMEPHHHTGDPRISLNGPVVTVLPPRAEGLTGGEDGHPDRFDHYSGPIVTKAWLDALNRLAEAGRIGSVSLVRLPAQIHGRQQDFYLWRREPKEKFRILAPDDLAASLKDVVQYSTEIGLREVSALRIKDILDRIISLSRPLGLNRGVNTAEVVAVTTLLRRLDETLEITKEYLDEKEGRSPRENEALQALARAVGLLILWGDFLGYTTWALANSRSHLQKKFLHEWPVVDGFEKTLEALCYLRVQMWDANDHRIRDHQAFNALAVTVAKATHFVEQALALSRRGLVLSPPVMRVVGNALENVYKALFPPSGPASDSVVDFITVDSPETSRALEACLRNGIALSRALPQLAAIYAHTPPGAPDDPLKIIEPYPLRPAEAADDFVAAKAFYDRYRAVLALVYHDTPWIAVQGRGVVGAFDRATEAGKVAGTIAGSSPLLALADIRVVVADVRSELEGPVITDPAQIMEAVRGYARVIRAVAKALLSAVLTRDEGLALRAIDANPAAASPEQWARFARTVSDYPRLVQQVIDPVCVEPLRQLALAAAGKEHDYRGEPITRSIAGGADGDQPLPESPPEQQIPLEPDVPEKALIDSGLTGEVCPSILTPHGFIYALDEFRRLTGEEPFVIDFSRIEPSTGGRYFAPDGPLETFFKQLTFAADKDHRTRVIFFRGLQLLNMHDANTLRFLLESLPRTVSIFSDHVSSPNSLAGGYGSPLSNIFHWVNDSRFGLGAYQPFTDERSRYLRALAEGIVDRITAAKRDGRSLQIDLFGGFRTGKTTVVNHLAETPVTSLEGLALFRFTSIMGDEEEIDSFIQKAGRDVSETIVVIDEATRMTTQALAHARLKIRYLVLLSHTRFPDFDDDDVIDLNVIPLSQVPAPADADTTAIAGGAGDGTIRTAGYILELDDEGNKLVVHLPNADGSFNPVELTFSNPGEARAVFTALDENLDDMARKKEPAATGLYWALDSLLSDLEALEGNLERRSAPPHSDSDALSDGLAFVIGELSREQGKLDGPEPATLQPDQQAPGERPGRRRRDTIRELPIQTPDLEVRTENGIAHVRVALSSSFPVSLPGILVQLNARFTELEKDERVGMIVLEGFDSPLFKLNGQEMATTLRGEGGLTDFLVPHVGLLAILDRLSKSDKRVVAVLEGDVFGPGLEVALYADEIVMVKGARLSLPYTKDGLVPMLGGARRLADRVGDQEAVQHLMRGDTETEVIDADVAYRTGLADHVVAKEDVESKIVEMTNGPTVEEIEKQIRLAGRMVEQATGLEEAAAGSTEIREQWMSLSGLFERTRRMARDLQNVGPSGEGNGASEAKGRERLEAVNALKDSLAEAMERLKSLSRALDLGEDEVLEPLGETSPDASGIDVQWFESTGRARTSSAMRVTHRLMHAGSIGEEADLLDDWLRTPIALLALSGEDVERLESSDDVSTLIQLVEEATEGRFSTSIEPRGSLVVVSHRGSEMISYEEARGVADTLLEKLLEADQSTELPGLGRLVLQAGTFSFHLVRSSPGKSFVLLDMTDVVETFRSLLGHEEMIRSSPLSAHGVENIRRLASLVEGFEWPQAAAESGARELFGLLQWFLTEGDNLLLESRSADRKFQGTYLNAVHDANNLLCLVNLPSLAAAEEAEFGREASRPTSKPSGAGRRPPQARDRAMTSRWGGGGRHLGPHPGGARRAAIHGGEMAMVPERWSAGRGKGMKKGGSPRVKRGPLGPVTVSQAMKRRLALVGGKSKDLVRRFYASSSGGKVVPMALDRSNRQLSTAVKELLQVRGEPVALFFSEKTSEVLFLFVGVDGKDQARKLPWKTPLLDTDDGRELTRIAESRGYRAVATQTLPLFTGRDGKQVLIVETEAGLARVQLFPPPNRPPEGGIAGGVDGDDLPSGAIAAVPAPRPGTKSRVTLANGEMTIEPGAQEVIFSYASQDEGVNRVRISAFNREYLHGYNFSPTNEWKRESEEDQPALAVSLPIWMDELEDSKHEEPFLVLVEETTPNVPGETTTDVTSLHLFAVWLDGRHVKVGFGTSGDEWEEDFDDESFTLSRTPSVGQGDLVSVKATRSPEDAETYEWDDLHIIVEDLDGRSAEEIEGAPGVRNFRVQPDGAVTIEFVRGDPSHEDSSPSFQMPPLFTRELLPPELSHILDPLMATVLRANPAIPISLSHFERVASAAGPASSGPRGPSPNRPQERPPRIDMWGDPRPHDRLGPEVRRAAIHGGPPDMTPRRWGEARGSRGSVGSRGGAAGIASLSLGRARAEYRVVAGSGRKVTFVFGRRGTRQAPFNVEVDFSTRHVAKAVRTALGQPLDRYLLRNSDYRPPKTRIEALVAIEIDIISAMMEIVEKGASSDNGMPEEWGQRRMPGLGKKDRIRLEALYGTVETLGREFQNEGGAWELARAPGASFWYGVFLNDAPFQQVRRHWPYEFSRGSGAGSARRGGASEEARSPKVVRPRILPLRPRTEAGVVRPVISLPQRKPGVPRGPRGFFPNVPAETLELERIPAISRGGNDIAYDGADAGVDGEVKPSTAVSRPTLRVTRDRDDRPSGLEGAVDRCITAALELAGELGLPGAIRVLARLRTLSVERPEVFVRLLDRKALGAALAKDGHERLGQMVNEGSLKLSHGEILLLRASLLVAKGGNRAELHSLVAKVVSRNQIGHAGLGAAGGLPPLPPAAVIGTSGAAMMLRGR